MPKLKKCAYSKCGKEFKPTYSSLQKCCSVKCAHLYNKEPEVKKRVREIKQGLKDHQYYTQILQAVFNTYIRMRDKGKPCISCGKEMKGTYHAGHFIPTTKQAVRFDEDNVHGQCIQCNLHLHGNVRNYAERLPKRIGWERFEALYEKEQQLLKLSIPELQEKIAHYREQIKQLKTNQI